MLNGAITSRYRILDKIKSHLAGERYLAEDTVLGRRVLLHLQPLEPTGSAGEDASAGRVRKAADLSHPNISAVLDLFDHEGRLVVISEYIEGTPLSRFIEEANYTLEHALNIAIQMCDAVCGAHEKEILHGSLCSDSVFITSGNCVRIGDFGLAPDQDKIDRGGSAAEKAHTCGHDMRCLIETTSQLLNERILAGAERNPRLLEVVRDILDVEKASAANLSPSELLNKLTRARELHRIGPLDERYQLATATGQVGVWDHDLKTGRLYMDPSLKAMLGYGEDEIEDTLEGWHRLIHAEDLQDVKQAINDHVGGASEKCEITHRRVHRDGDIRWFLTRGTAVRDAEGKLLRIVGTDTDVTEVREAEQALHMRERQLRSFVEHTPLAVAMFDREMRYIVASTRWLEDRGLEGTDVTGKRHYDLLSDVRDDWRAVHERCLAGATEKCEESQFTRADGSREWIRWEVHPWYDTKGGIGGIIVFWELITQRKLAEEKLRESEERFRTLAQLSPDIIVVHADGKIVFVNEAGTRMLGATGPDEIIGRPVMEFVHADFIDAVTDRIGKVLGEGKTVNFMEQQLVALDGRVVDVEAGSKPLTFDGKPAVQVVARDISERLRAQEALRKSEAYYRGVIEDQTELICRFTPDTVVTFVNDAVCRYFGRGREEMIGKSFLPFIPEQDRPLILAAIQALTPENPVGGVEHRIKLESGDARWQQWTNRAFFGDDNRVVGFQAVGRDITERKRSENMLKVTMRKLRAQRRQLTDSNLALKQVLDHIERERQDYKQRLCQDIEMALSPLIARLRESVNPGLDSAVDEVESSMKAALTKDIDVFRDRYASLTSRELEVCEMIKHGRTSKEIADELNLSLLTVHKHREQIRKKLGLKNKGVNLSTYLRSR